MDSELKRRLTKLSEQIDSMKETELIFRQLKATEKSQFGMMFLKQEGKTLTEREHAVFASREWRQFQEGLVQAEVAYNHMVRKLELLKKAYDAEHITYKLETSAIQRQV